MLKRSLVIGVLMALPAVAQAKVRTEEIKYKHLGQVYQGYLAYDDAIEGERPGVLIVHEWWGHNSYVRSRAEKLAKLGYTAFALDMYGDGKTAGHPKDAAKFSQQALADFDSAKGRFLAAKKVLEDHKSTNAKHISAIGYCFGGAVVLNMARAGVDLDVVGSFHGSLNPHKSVKTDAIKTKLFVAHGADDPFVPPEQVEAFKTEMKKAKAELVFKAYPGAKHAFTNPGATTLGEKFKLPLAYQKEADLNSWETFLGLLKQSHSK